MEEYFERRKRVDTADLDPDFQRDRNANDSKLKSRFEHIFRKYERDFTGIGDEVDLETGDIVVNNGHLESMQYEVDPGAGSPSQLVRVFAENTEDGLDEALDHEEDDTPDNEENDELPESEGAVGETDCESSSDKESDSGYTSSGILTEVEDDLDSTNPPNESDRASSGRFEIDSGPQDERVEALSATKVPESRPVLPRVETNGGKGGFVSDAGSPCGSSSTTSLENLPAALRDSVRAIQDGKADLQEASVQKLVQNIANQLSHIIATSAKSSHRPRNTYNEGADALWTYPELPTRKRKRTGPTDPRPALLSPIALSLRSPGVEESLWAPVKMLKRHKKYKLKHLNGQAEDSYADGHHEGRLSPDANPATSVDQHDAFQLSSERQAPPAEAVGRICARCAATSTPLWRNTPRGKICNSCWMYFYRHGLLPIGRDRWPDEDVNDSDGPDSVQGDSHRGPEGDESIASIMQARYPANTSRRIIAGEFTLEDDRLIKKLREKTGLMFSEISRHLGGKDASVIADRYYHHLIGADPAALLSASTRTRKAYTEAEDMLILEYRAKGLDWRDIAGKIKGRSASSLATHFCKRFSSRKTARDQGASAGSASRSRAPAATSEPLHLAIVQDSTQDGPLDGLSKMANETLYPHGVPHDASQPAIGPANTAESSQVLERDSSSEIEARQDTTTPGRPIPTAKDPAKNRFITVPTSREQLQVEIQEPALILAHLPLRDQPEPPERHRTPSLAEVLYTESASPGGVQCSHTREASPGQAEPDSVAASSSPSQGPVYASPARWDRSTMPYYVLPTAATPPLNGAATSLSRDAHQGTNSTRGELNTTSPKLFQDSDKTGSRKQDATHRPASSTRRSSPLRSNPPSASKPRPLLGTKPATTLQKGKAPQRKAIRVTDERSQTNSTAPSSVTKRNLVVRVERVIDDSEDEHDSEDELA